MKKTVITRRSFFTIIITKFAMLKIIFLLISELIFYPLKKNGYISKR